MKNLFTLLLVLPLLTFAQEPPEMLEFLEVTVKHGHGRQFHEGMQKYKKCLSDNKSDANWNAWTRVQGEGDVIVFSRDIQNFSDYDNEPSEAIKKCRSVVESDLIPNSEKVSTTIVKPMSEWSLQSPAEGKVVNATFFQVDNPWEFMDTIGEIIETVKTSPDYQAYWMSSVGGDDYDFMVARFYDKFGDRDKDAFNPWKIYGEQHGKEKLKAIQARLNKSVKNVSEFMYKLNEDMSYNGVESTN